MMTNSNENEQAETDSAQTPAEAPEEPPTMNELLRQARPPAREFRITPTPQTEEDEDPAA